MFNRIKEFIKSLINQIGSSNTCPTCGYHCTGTSVFCCPPILNESDDDIEDDGDDRNYFCNRCHSYHPKNYECLMKR